MPEVPRRRLIARWWRSRVIETVDQVAVNDAVHDAAGWSPHYLFMTTMSAGIAVLGLLLSSPAVVIGAMLISPLMGPIIGLGFALATVDARQIRRAAFALAAGSGFAILLCAAIVLVSPLQNVTSEIAARTRPNLFDLAVALFSALAGSYATIRGRSGTIVGVAIATALMPPLATVGFGLATGNGAVFLGALLLFVTNFVTIALTAAVMARLYGFGRALSPQQTVFQSILVLATLAALAVPLGLSLRRLAWEGIAGRQARVAINTVFGDQARISQIDLDYAADPIKVTATVLTPRYRADANRAAETAFDKAAGRHATMAIEQYRVGTGPGDAAAAAIRAAEAAPQGNPADAQAAALADRLALVAGVGAGQVTIDRVAKRARVEAATLPGAGIAAYHALEDRVAAAAPGWQVALFPPAAALAPVNYADGNPDESGRAALADAIWAARRLGLAVEVSGPTAAAENAVGLLTKAGVAARRIGGGAAVTLHWAVPSVTPPASGPRQ